LVFHWGMLLGSTPLQAAVVRAFKVSASVTSYFVRSG
jgi:hypothetical protein